MTKSRKRLKKKSLRKYKKKTFTSSRPLFFVLNKTKKKKIKGGS